MLLYNIFSLIITFTLIVFYLHLRLTRKIIAIELTPNNIEKYFTYFFVLFIFCLGILIFFILLKKKSAFGLNGLRVLEKYNIFYHTYGLVFDYIGPDYTMYLLKLAKKIINFSKKEHLIILFFFLGLPRMIILLVLCWEIFFCKVLHYYFYSLLLLLIPLGFRFMVFIFKDLSPRLLPIFSSFLDLRGEYPPEGFGDITKKTCIAFALKPEYAFMDMDDFMFNFYYPVLYLRGHMEVLFLPLHREINNYVLYLYYGLQTLFWGYILLL